MLFSTAHAANSLIYDTKTGQVESLQDFARAQTPGTILVLGEQHATKDNENDPSTIQHHLNQALLLEALNANGLPVNTGMEFLTYTDQAAVDAFLDGQIDEPTFLKQAHWSSSPFALYRRQILNPRFSGGRALALNIPWSIATQVAEHGPQSLNDEQKSLLPPVWERGSDVYFERFRDAMGEHAPADQLDNYFWAQSLWDDTMAWNALRGTSPEALTLIIVGEFHVAFNQGLPARLLRQQQGTGSGSGAGTHRVVTLIQQEVKTLSPEEIRRVSQPDPKYGALADALFIWAP